MFASNIATTEISGSGSGPTNGFVSSVLNGLPVEIFDSSENSSELAEKHILEVIRSKLGRIKPTLSEAEIMIIGDLENQRSCGDDCSNGSGSFEHNYDFTESIDFLRT